MLKAVSSLIVLVTTYAFLLTAPVCAEQVLIANSSSGAPEWYTVKKKQSVALSKPVSSSSADTSTSQPKVEGSDGEQITAPDTTNSTTAPTSSPTTPSNNAANQSQPSTSNKPEVLASPPRRAPPPPIDGVFPFTEFVGAAGQLPIGVPDAGAIYPIEKYLWKQCPWLAKARIRIYGWVDPGIELSTSSHSNYPLSYQLVPRQPELDQAVIRIERVPNTVQKEHLDWGFRLTNLAGTDYRFTTAQGWFSDQLLSNNRLYGWDPVECYGLLYIPKIFQGAVVKVGRYISPPDIEAQLSPDNYLYTHSLMFTVDTYTQTGVLTTIQLTKRLAVSAGIHAGSDMAPWNKSAVPTAQVLLRYTTKNNRDGFYGGIDSINSGYYRMSGTHDNLQQFNFTWGHVFNERIHTYSEAYFIYQYNALSGGTVNNGPPRWFFTETGPGRYLPGTSPAWGVVNYTNIKLTNKDFLTLRPVDFLDDCRGERTGYSALYGSWTIGLTHRFNNLLCIRPEIRYESALTGNTSPYNNGLNKSQFTFGVDLIQRF